MPPSAVPAETDDVLFDPPAEKVVIEVDAPWGINPDTNKPYTMSPEARAAAGARMAEGRTRKAQMNGSTRTRAAKAARATVGPPPLANPPRGKPGPKPKAKAPSRGESLANLADAVGWGLAVFGKRFNQKPLIADGVAIGMHGPGLMLAIADWADEANSPYVTRALDFLTRTSPYAKITAAAAPLLAQLAANHRVIPSGLMGSIDPERLAADFLAHTADVAATVEDELRDEREGYTEYPG